MKHPFAGAASGFSAAGGTREAAPGFPGEALILTLEGELPVAHLVAGDRVITRDRGMSVLRRIEVIETCCDLVRIKAGSLGHVGDKGDTLLPAAQPILLRDWRAQALHGQPQAVAPARDLVDGEFITHAGRRQMRLYRLHFDASHVLYVDGLEQLCDGPESLHIAA